MDDKKNKKKRTHFFEIYIIKVLKQVNELSGITANAKQQLNSALCIIAKHISSIVLNLTIISKKKTISDKEISSALKIVLSGELLNNSIMEGEKAIDNYKKSKNDKTLTCKQMKAGIIFPPSLVEKFLRNFDYTKIMVSALAPVYFAAVLEYLTYEILDLSNLNCKDNKRIRINIRDLEVSIRNDTELNNLFTSLNINLLGGGVIPFIHSSILNKTVKKPLKHNDPKINRRYHSGTVAIRNIKKQQKFSDTLVFAKSSFEQFVRQLFKENNWEDKLSKDIFIILQHFIEQYIVKILTNANFLAIHAGRIKVTPVDIGLISFFNNKSKNPYVQLEDNSIEIFSISDENGNEDENQIQIEYEFSE
jgi:histone H2A